MAGQLALTVSPPAVGLVADAQDSVLWTVAVWMNTAKHLFQAFPSDAKVSPVVLKVIGTHQLSYAVSLPPWVAMRFQNSEPFASDDWADRLTSVLR